MPSRKAARRAARVGPGEDRPRADMGEFAGIGHHQHGPAGIDDQLLGEVGRRQRIFGAGAGRARSDRNGGPDRSFAGRFRARSPRLRSMPFGVEALRRLGESGAARFRRPWIFRRSAIPARRRPGAAARPGRRRRSAARHCVRARSAASLQPRGSSLVAVQDGPGDCRGTWRHAFCGPSGKSGKASPLRGKSCRLQETDYAPVRRRSC